MSTLENLTEDLEQLCNLRGLPGLRSNWALMRALEDFVKSCAAKEQLNTLANRLENGAFPPCFVPAAELRAMLEIPQGHGTPKAPLGWYYADAVRLLQKYGWAATAKKIHHTIVRGYDKPGHDGITLVVTNEDGTLIIQGCRPHEYHSLKQLK